MRVILIFLVVLFPLLGESYKNLILSIDNSLAIKSAKYLQNSARELAIASKGDSLPSIDIKADALYLQEQPTVTLHLPPPLGSLTAPMATSRKFEAELRVTYPIFSGFAISSKIQKSFHQAEIAKLKVKDLKRNLILQLTMLFGKAKILQSTLKAQKEAILSAKESLKKAQKMYENGLLAPVEVANIKATLFSIEASISKTESLYNQTVQSISYLINRDISNLKGSIAIRNLPSIKRVLKLAYSNRADIKILKEQLSIDRANIKLAKSKFYPKVGVVAGLKRQGDTLALDGDGFTNKNQSYLALNVDMNLYSGGKDLHTVEALKYKKLSNYSTFLDYKLKVKSEIKNGFEELRALKVQKRTSIMQLKAQKKYYKQIKARFDNGLSSADELSRALANLAYAKAKYAQIQNLIKIQRAKIWLMIGVKSFKRALR